MYGVKNMSYEKFISNVLSALYENLFLVKIPTYAEKLGSRVFCNLKYRIGFYASFCALNEYRRGMRKAIIHGYSTYCFKQSLFFTNSTFHALVYG